MTVMIFIPSLHLDSLPLPTPWPQNPLTLERVILNGIFFNQGPRDKPRRIGIRSSSHQHETWPPVVMLGGDGYRPQALGWWTVLLTTESSNGGKEGRIVAVWWRSYKGKGKIGELLERLRCLLRV